MLTAMPDAAMTWLWPVVFGLMGFVEPCAVGMTLLFIFTLEGRGAAQKVRQVVLFTITRNVVMGLLGILAAAAGSWFLGAQRGVWLAVGIVYMAIGVLYVPGRI